MATNVYVDAFNLYYGCLKDTPHRWLDLGALCGRLLPKCQFSPVLNDAKGEIRKPAGW